jgi:hypothetical protein
VLKYSSLNQLRPDFAPAEEAFLRGLPQTRLWHLMHRIYLEAILMLPPILAGKGEVEQLAAYQQVLLDLAQTAVTLLTPSYDSQTAVLTEFVFPGLGGKVRQAWHNIAGKWALSHISQLQTAFNQQLLNWFMAQAAQDQAATAEINLLTTQLAAQQAQLDKAFAEIAKLQTRLATLEPESQKPS